MSLNYTTYVSQIANIMAIGSTDANFTTMLPEMIDYAEQRIYRDIDLLYTQTTDATKQVSSGVQEFTLSTAVGTFITVDQLNIITPAATLSSVGSRVTLTPVSPEFMNAAFPTANSSLTGTPEYYAMRSNTVVLLGPVPDGAYYAETIGIQRPASLSSANSSTILTQYIPDVFVAASMVFAAGFMRDFGAQADNPQMGASWESQYKLLLQSASVEQFRAKHESQGWSSQQPSPLVQRS
jgi:hypothetical protein